MTKRFVRSAEREDAMRIAAIYNEGIEDRVATFQTVLQDEAAIVAWMKEDRPIFVSGDASGVMAFAVAHPYHAAPYYDGIRVFSVYAARQARGRGFGEAALAALISESKKRGWWKLLSRVFPENMASRKLLRRLGFREAGRLEKHSTLDGIWRDVLIVEKLLI